MEDLIIGLKVRTWAILLVFFVATSGGISFGYADVLGDIETLKTRDKKQEEAISKIYIAIYTTKEELKKEDTIFRKEYREDQRENRKFRELILREISR